MKTVVMMLSSGQEIIGNMKPNTDDAKFYYLEFPQSIKWWREKDRGQCYEFVPFIYGANMQTNIPIRKIHVIAMSVANVDIIQAYNRLVDEVLVHMERMVGLKRHLDNKGDTLEIKK